MFKPLKYKFFHVVQFEIEFKRLYPTVILNYLSGTPNNSDQFFLLKVLDSKSQHKMNAFVGT